MSEQELNCEICKRPFEPINLKEYEHIADTKSLSSVSVTSVATGRVLASFVACNICRGGFVKNLSKNEEGRERLAALFKGFLYGEPQDETKEQPKEEEELRTLYAGPGGSDFEINEGTAQTLFEQMKEGKSTEAPKKPLEEKPEEASEEKPARESGEKPNIEDAMEAFLDPSASTDKATNVQDLKVGERFTPDMLDDPSGDSQFDYYEQEYHRERFPPTK